MPSVANFREGLDPHTLQMIDRLRAIVAASHPLLDERIKWNAPSFALGDDDRITLGIERKGGVRLVLHRGAKVQGVQGFAFDDVDALAKWRAPDRGVIVWRELAGIEAVAVPLQALCRRWVEAVAASADEA